MQWDQLEVRGEVGDCAGGEGENEERGGGEGGGETSVGGEGLHVGAALVVDDEGGDEHTRGDLMGEG